MKELWHPFFEDPLMDKSFSPAEVGEGCYSSALVQLDQETDFAVEI